MQAISSSAAARRSTESSAAAAGASDVPSEEARSAQQQKRVAANPPHQSAAATRFGCSECLCVAIESHRPALLRELLGRRDVVYRDMFWAPHWFGLRRDRHCRLDEYYPLLHRIDPNDDLSRIGRAHCRHEVFDEELWRVTRPNDRLLVSLPLLARWHSSAQFDAEQMLRDSGRFDYSEPQFCNLFIRARAPDDETNGHNEFGDIYRDDSNAEYRYAFQQVLYCAFETRRSKSFAFAFPFTDAPTRVYEPTSRPSDLITVWGRFCTDFADIHKHFGTLSQHFEQFNSPHVPDFGSDSRFLADLRTQLESGADLNSFNLKTRTIFRFGRRRPVVRSIECLTALFYACTLTQPFKKEQNSDFVLQYNDLIRFLLRHGLSVFLRFEMDSQTASDFQLADVNLFNDLFSKSPRSLWPFTRAIAAQLLSLGYGRRELQPDGLPLLDANLDTARKAIVKHEAAGRQDVSRELQTLVQRFDAGPLSLRELSRIAIRRAVGGADFARRVHSNAFSSRLPPLLFRYVSDPTELLLSDAELNGLLVKPTNPCVIH